MKYQKIAMIFLALIGPCAFADGGSSVGHGGVIFQCGSKVQLVDAWEGEDAGFPLSLGNNPNAPMRDLAKTYLDRLNFFEPLRAKEYRDISAQFLADLDLLAVDPKSPNTALVRFTTGVLPNSLDSDEITQPHGCIKKQAVIQLPELIEGDKLFIISLKLWSQMTNEMRVLTMFHEINVKHLFTSIKSASNSTRPARLLNRFIGSKIISGSRTICDYLKSLYEFGLENTIAYGDFDLIYPDSNSTCWTTTRLLKTATNTKSNIMVTFGNALFGPPFNAPMALVVGYGDHITFDEKSRNWTSFTNSTLFDESVAGGDSKVYIGGGTVKPLGNHSFELIGAVRATNPGAAMYPTRPNGVAEGLMGHANFRFKDDGVTPIEETILP